MPAAALIAGATVLGSVISASSASKAAKQQQQGLQSGIDTQKQMFDTTRNDLLPYNTAGQEDFAAYNKMGPFSFAPTEAQLESTPGYQFTKTQGLKAVQNSAAARGLGVSGAAMKGGAAFATGLADNTFQQNFDRALTSYGTNANKLIAGAQLGENAGAQTGQQGTAAGQGIAQSQASQGQAAAAGSVGVANALTGGINNTSNLLLTNQLLKAQGYNLFGANDGADGTMYAGTTAL